MVRAVTRSIALRRGYHQPFKYFMEQLITTNLIIKINLEQDPQIMVAPLFLADGQSISIADLREIIKIRCGSQMTVTPY